MNIGTKAHNLTRLQREFGVAVPEFIVVPFEDTISDFSRVRDSLESAIDSHLNGGGSLDKLAVAIDDVMDTVVVSESAVTTVAEQAGEREFTTVSFRTSAALEDAHGTSFAGQYESFVNVPFSADALRAHIVDCFRSVVSQRVIRYAKSQGITHFTVGGSVVVQRMFFGTHSGVLFTENGSGSLVIASVESWRNTVVDGDAATEYVVPRDRVETASIPEQVRELCRQALRIETAVGSPIDVEWAYDGRDVEFLQFRPVTVPMLDTMFEWDSTNISENYPGITLPLTYSYIRTLYAGVYPAFLRLLGTPESMLRDNAVTFNNMLGYLNGRVYYRISNWYEVVKFLPGRRNQEFFEAMLNPVSKRGEARPNGRLDGRSVWAIARFAWLLLRSDALSRGFRDRFAEKLAFFESYHPTFVNAPATLGAIQSIRVRMLDDWAVPIINDVKLMVFHGILKSAFFNGDHTGEYLEFLQGLTDRASIRPLQQLTALGREIRALMDAEKAATLDALVSTPSWVTAQASAKKYITAYGARTPEELKLESVRLTDQVTDVMALALKAADAGTVDELVEPKTTTRWPAHVPAWQRPILGFVARHTRRAIDWRERFRFNRAQTFNLTRDAYNAIGDALVAESSIEEPRDIYWLTEQEVDEIVNGHAWSLDARVTVERRKAEFAEFEEKNMPLAVRGAGRIPGKHLEDVRPSGDNSILDGSGVAPGVLTAPVVVASEFDASLDVRGKILVVHHIDPGWTLLFTQAAGILAERGNALSHA
ncbi:MAG: hypothetical protein RLZZ40_986, partial [Actinomycetota bacterium]